MLFLCIHELCCSLVSYLKTSDKQGAMKLNQHITEPILGSISEVINNGATR